MPRLFALALLTFATPLQAAPQHFECGGAQVSIEVLDQAPLDTVLKVSRGERLSQLNFDNIDFIGGDCLANAQGAPRIVFQAVCAGSGCQDLSNWGVIDPISLKVLLVPADGNGEQAQRLLGHAPTPLALERLLSIGKEAQRLGIEVP